MPRRRLPYGLLVAVLIGAACATFMMLRLQGQLSSPRWDRLEAWAPALLGASIVTVLVSLVVAGVAKKVTAPAARGLGRLQVLVVALAWMVAVAGAAGGFGGAAVGVGLVGFGLTLALQRPILAMAGWASIQFGGMFRPGDRIQVGAITGDVLDVSMFSTRLWEVGAADSPTPGRPTGRIRIVSNALFLEESVGQCHIRHGHDLR